MVRAVYLGQPVTIDWTDGHLVVDPPSATAVVTDALTYASREQWPTWTPTGPGVPRLATAVPGSQEWDEWVAWALQYSDRDAQVPRPPGIPYGTPDGLVY